MATTRLPHAYHIASVHGENIWLQVKTAAGLSHPLSEPWASTCPYADGIIYGLVGAACSVTGMSAYDVGREYGAFFVQV